MTPSPTRPSFFSLFGRRRRGYPLSVALPLLPVHFILWLTCVTVAYAVASAPDPSLPDPVDGVVQTAQRSGDIQHGSYQWNVTFTYTGPAGDLRTATAPVMRDIRLPELNPGDPIHVPGQTTFALPLFLGLLAVLGGAELLLVHRVGDYFAKRVRSR